MAHKVIWTLNAVSDVHDLAEYISRDSYHYAELVEDRIHQAADSLAYFPLRHRIVPEFDRADVREIFVHNYRIIYHVSDDCVTILSVIHTARDLTD